MREREVLKGHDSFEKLSDKYIKKEEKRERERGRDG
jgi:hypothetical protein